jgi:Big-like domain-containing protein
MASANEPMVKLDPDGKASILSYNVPEPTSYPGRNYIDLQLDPSWFKQGVSPAPKPDAVKIVQTTDGRASTAPANRPEGSPGTTGNLSPQAPSYLLVTPSKVVRLEGGPGAGQDGLALASAHSAGSEVTRLDPATLEAITQAGKAVQVYRSLYGTLNFRLVEQPLAVQSGGGSMPADPIVPSFLLLSVTSPKNGDTISGPSAGVTMRLTGTAEVVIDGDPAPVQKVEVQIGSAPFQTATPGSGNDWASWSASGTVTTPGTVKLTARATHQVGTRTLTKTNSLSVTILFTQTQPGDTTPPVVTITSPANGALVSGSPDAGSGGAVPVAVKGTAADAQSGVQLVKLIPDGDLAKAQDATPKAPGNWSEWAGSLPLPAGQHTVTARCADKAGNLTATTVTITVSTQPVVVPKITRLLLAESYRLSTYLGNYGAGRPLKTFTLLPGEKTKISVKAYTRSETDRKDASSILDSFTKESADDFEQATTAEQSYKENYDESFKYSVRGEAQASWGWGSAKVSGEVSGGTNAAREEFAKNVVNATQKHASKASAKRDVQVNTSYEVKEQTGEETSIEREIENVNVSRTLNFVFRQMNQEFITILHLVDVRVAFFRVDVVNGVEVPTYREATLPQLKSFLAEVIMPDRQQEVQKAIFAQVGMILDYRDEPHSFYEEKELPDGSKYLRVLKDLTSTYKDPATGTEVVVPGLILAVTKNVMRTEGIVVEALLGQADALDAYSHGLQDEAVQAKHLANAVTQAEIDKRSLALKIIDAKDAAAAKVFDQVSPFRVDDGFKLVLSKGQEDGGGQPGQK